MSVTMLIGDVRARLKELPSAYFDCVVTSPPYWGLRDYAVDGQLGLERTLGEHIDVMVDVFREVRRVLKQQGTCWLNYGDCYAAAPNGKSAAAYKADGTDDRTFRDKPFSTVGPILEPGHSQGRGPRGERADQSRYAGGPYAAAILDPTGGASGGGVRGSNKGNTGGTTAGRIVAGAPFFDPNYRTPRGEFVAGDRMARIESGGRVVAGGFLKPKDLCMIPNRLAIALQDDGWWVRSEIIWHKRNPMPESIYDRPTTAHEKVWLLTKGEEYFYNDVAIREAVSPATHARLSQDVANQRGSLRANGGTRPERPMKAVRGRSTHGRHTPGDALPAGERRTEATYVEGTAATDRNARNVWSIATAPFDGEFCLRCRSYYSGKQKRALRVDTIRDGKKEERRRYCGTCDRYDRWLSHFATFPPDLAARCIKAGVPPSTCHLCGEARTAEECGGICVGQARDSGRVLDPFGGAGTVALVAQRLGLDCTLIELNPDYAAMAQARLQADAAARQPIITAEAAE